MSAENTRDEFTAKFSPPKVCQIEISELFEYSHWLVGITQL